MGEEKTLYLYDTANIVPNQSWRLISEVSLWLGYCCSVELNSKYNGWLFISTMLICFCGINKYARVSLGINKPFLASKATVTVGVNVQCLFNFFIQGDLKKTQRKHINPKRLLITLLKSRQKPSCLRMSLVLKKTFLLIIKCYLYWWTVLEMTKWHRKKG